MYAEMNQFDKNRLYNIQLEPAPTDENRRKVSEANLGKRGQIPSEETKRKISEAKRGRIPTATEGHRVPHTEETKQKMRAAWALRKQRIAAEQAAANNPPLPTNAKNPLVA